MSKQLATEQEKRDFFNEQVLGTFIDDGQHLLQNRLHRVIPLIMSNEDRQALVDRMMRTPKQEDVYHLLNDMVCKSDMTVFSEDQIELRDAPEGTPLNVVFKHFLPPSAKDGGWVKAHEGHPKMKAWSETYYKYVEAVNASSRNGENLRHAWVNDLPIDVAITTSTLGKKNLMRFVIYEPYPDNQKGFPMYSTPTVK